MNEITLQFFSLLFSYILLPEWRCRSLFLSKHKGMRQNILSLSGSVCVCALFSIWLSHWIFERGRYKDMIPCVCVFACSRYKWNKLLTFKVESSQAAWKRPNWNYKEEIRKKYAKKYANGKVQDKNTCIYYNYTISIELNTTYLIIHFVLKLNAINNMIWHNTHTYMKSRNNLQMVGKNRAFHPISLRWSWFQ